MGRNKAVVITISELQMLLLFKAPDLKRRQMTKAEGSAGFYLQPRRKDKVEGLFW